MNDSICKSIVKNKPVAKFYYQGDHTHPVRRTILVIGATPRTIVGYEIREGNTVRKFSEIANFIKVYDRSQIVNWGDYSRLTKSKKNKKNKPKSSTLVRTTVLQMLAEGV